MTSPITDSPKAEAGTPALNRPLPDRTEADVLRERMERDHGKIVTTFVYPPIPYRGCDWQAMRDGDEPSEEGPSPPVGRGATEVEALRDLAEQLEDGK